jgi:TRAP-type C4-dicarboxylate transport system substrate-binding protein
VDRRAHVAAVNFVEMEKSRERLREPLLRALMVGGLWLVASVTALAQDKLPELKLSTAQGTAFPLGKAADRWRALLTENAALVLEVKMYPGATLAQRDPAREIMAVRDGAADLAVGSALAWSPQVPALAVYALPWLAAEAREQDALARDAVVRQAITSRLEGLGVVLLHVAPLGDRVVATSKGPVEKPADVAGLRIRTSALGLMTDTLVTLGAKPAAMPFAEAQAAFRAGTLDGQEAAASTLAATRIATVGQKVVTRWGAFNDVMLFVVRRDVWARLNEAQRTMMQAAAVAAATEADALAREEAALAELTKQGVTIVRLSPAQRNAFRKAVEDVWVKWTPMIGPDLVHAAEVAVGRAPR